MNNNNNNNRKIQVIAANDRYKPIPNLAYPPNESFSKKPHVSTWFITLNSNQAESRDYSTNQIGGYLIQILTNLFTNPNQLVKFLQVNPDYNPGNVQLTVDMLNDPTLFPDIGDGEPNARLTYVQETGSIKNRVHLHGEFRIIHYLVLWINYQKLQDLVREELGGTPFDGVYLNMKFVKSALPIYNYMLKGDSFKKSAAKRINRSEEDYEESIRMLRSFNLD